MSIIFAEVVVPLPLKVLTYQVPAHYHTEIKVGSGVVVPLGSNKLVLAITVALHKRAPVYPTKTILALLYSYPLCKANQLAFFQWMAHYYMVSMGAILAMGMPKSVYAPHNMIFQLHPVPKSASQATAQELLTALSEQPLTYAKLKKLLKGKSVFDTLVSCLFKEVIQAMPYLDQVVADRDYLILNAKVASIESVEAASRHQGAILAYLRTTTTPITEQMLLQKGYSKSALTALCKKGILGKHRPNFTMPLHPLLTLTRHQKQSLDAIEDQFLKKQVVLLYGIIGSGKTLLYMHLIQKVLQQKKQVLFLLPEISLVTHMVMRLEAFWAPWLRVYHSKQTTQERFCTWTEVSQRETVLVIGTRSALFLPFTQLSLIIVDEEHDTAYKHAGKRVPYHARDCSMVLAKQYGAKVLLGSGTPSIESYYKAQMGKYGLVTLNHKFGKASAPNVFFIDLKREEKQKTLQDHFAVALLTALKQNQQQGGQAMVFQNRRGYANYLLCAVCGWIPRCLSCAVSLTYHQATNHLLCHYCGYSCSPFQRCSDCGSKQLHNKGFGTEKIAETLQLIFPELSIGRMDVDSTKKKNVHQMILEQLSTGAIDILVGTQMIAKGLDFTNMRLIGVLGIDGLLYFPDFRAHERCFQLITQLAGRAGRGDHPGNVYIQTIQPHHPLFYHLKDGNYRAMYEAELAERKQFLYPPYVKLVKITLSCLDKDLLQWGSMAMKQALLPSFGKLIIGPQPPLIEKISNYFLMDLFVKIPPSAWPQLQAVKERLAAICRKTLQAYQSIKIAWDIDPI